MNKIFDDVDKDTILAKLQWIHEHHWEPVKLTRDDIIGMVATVVPLTDQMRRKRYGDKADQNEDFGQEKQAAALRNTLTAIGRKPALLATSIKMLEGAVGELTIQSTPGLPTARVSIDPEEALSNAKILKEYIGVLKMARNQFV